MKNLNLILFVLLIFAFQSCQKLKYGNVVERWHEPENSYMIFMPITTSNGKTTTTTMVPYYVHDSEDWCIKVTGIGTKGDTITRKYYVSQAAYDTLTIGKFICVDGACNDDTNNTKERK